MNNVLNTLTSILVLIVFLVLSFIGGCVYSENKKPEIRNTDTITIITKDTII
jgi:hypothetical protein